MTRLLLACVTAGLVFVSVSAQQDITRPNFSGRWIEESQPKPFDGPGGFCPKDCVIEQTPDQLLAKSWVGTRTVDLRNPIVKVLTSDKGVRAERSIAAKWEGASLIVTTTVKELTTSSPGITDTVWLALRDNRLVISGRAHKPFAEAFDFEIIYRRSGREE